MPPQSSSPHGSPPRFYLETPTGSVELREHATTVGRSGDCQAVLDDPLVSRRHARFWVEGDRVAIEDLGSANGVHVNGKRIKGRTWLNQGDQVMIGKSSFTLRARRQRPAYSGQHRQLAATLHDVPNPDGSEDTTQSADVLDVLGPVVDKVLALGRADEAERLLTTTLEGALESARKGRTLTPRFAERIADYAMAIGLATGKTQWLDFCLELYIALGRVLPAPLVDRLYERGRAQKTVSLSLLRSYILGLKNRGEVLAPKEAFALTRLEGLERMLGS